MGVVMPKLSRDDLSLLAEFLRTGRLAPVIDKRYPLDEVPEAVRYLEEGRVMGKVVITVAHAVDG